MQKQKHSLASKLLLGLTVLFFYLPIIYIVVFSFNDSRSLTHFSGFSLQWYEKMFSDRTMMEAVGYTIFVAVVATVVSTIVGTLAAIGLSRSRKLLRNVVEQVNNLPVMNPEIVTGISMMLLFTFIYQTTGLLQRGYATLLISHITFCIPYVVLQVMPKLRQLNPAHYEAALDLGAKPGYALRKIVLPQILPGIVTGFIFAFTLSIDDFVVSYFTSQDVSNLSMTIYSMARRGLSPKINALSTIMFVSVMILLVIINVRSSRQNRKEKKT